MPFLLRIFLVHTLLPWTCRYLSVFSLFFLSTFSFDKIIVPCYKFIFPHLTCWNVKKRRQNSLRTEIHLWNHQSWLYQKERILFNLYTEGNNIVIHRNWKEHTRAQPSESKWFYQNNFLIYLRKSTLSIFPTI